MVALDLERPTLELPSTKLMRRFRLWQTMEVLSRSISHYCFLYAVGHHDGKPRLLGVLLLNADRQFLAARYDLSRCGWLPGSGKWKTLSSFLHNYGDDQVPIRRGLLDEYRNECAHLRHRKYRVLAFSPTYCALGDPETLLTSLFEECVTMGKVMLEDDGRVTFHHSETPTVCEFIRELAPVMNAAQLITAAKLTAEQVDEDAFSVKTVLLERMIRLLQVSDHRISPEQVERFMAAQERIVHLA